MGDETEAVYYTYGEFECRMVLAYVKKPNEEGYVEVEGQIADPGTRSWRKTGYIEEISREEVVKFQLDVLNTASALFAAADAAAEAGDDDICGLCGQPGADKFAHPCYWPGEQKPDTELVHAECEAMECRRAHAMLSPQEREAFLRSIR